jgi:23S rRNA (cytidine2498-2'-O)-methyltransferase
MIALVGHCRAGFEPEAAADFERIARTAGSVAAIDAPNGRGFVVATLDAVDVATLASALRDIAPIFVRSTFVGLGPLRLFEHERSAGPTRPDRVAAMLPMLAPLARALPRPLRSPYGELRIEMPDTNDGKALSGLCRALERPFADALRARNLLVDGERDGAARSTLHLLFADGAHAYVGASAPPWRSKWPMGIARLRMPHAAPSRSTLKLAEAFATFLGADEPQLVRAGMKAVDLGAAPGGWTWQLAHRGLRVVAVDNGALKGDVASDSLVTHLRTDGLAYRPRKPVDWMVCDIATQPSRIAALIARWMAHGDARRSIFNLKLPMRRRYDEVLRCDAMIREALARAGVRHTLALRQLYHDREEVTGYCARSD